MIGPNMSDEQYRKMPRYAKVIYWLIVLLFIISFIYFLGIKLNLINLE